MNEGYRKLGFSFINLSMTHVVLPIRHRARSFVLPPLGGMVDEGDGPAGVAPGFVVCRFSEDKDEDWGGFYKYL